MDLSKYALTLDKVKPYIRFLIDFVLDVLGTLFVSEAQKRRAP